MSTAEAVLDRVETTPEAVAPEEHTSADSHALNSSLPDELLEQSNANVEETSGCFFVDQDWCGRHTRARSHTNVAGT